MTNQTETATVEKANRTRKPAAPKTAAKEAPKAAKKATPQRPPAVLNGPRGKIGVVVGMLKRPHGASVPELMAETSWQAHSVRGAIAGAIKKKLGLKVISTKTEAGRIYRIETADDAA